MTKADVVDALYEKGEFSKKQAADIVELVFDTIKGALSEGQKLKISGFGNFVVREKRSRIGRNPQTGETIEITARKVLTFRPSQVLRAEVNAALEGKPIDPAALASAKAKDKEEDEA